MKNRFEGHGLCIDGLVFLSPAEALHFLEEDAVLVDLRQDFEKNGREFQVRDLISLPHPELATSYGTLPRDRPLILADCVGLMSKQALCFLSERGYASVASLNGGILDWEKDGLPLLIDRDGELTGGCACRLRRRNLR